MKSTTYVQEVSNLRGHARLYVRSSTLRLPICASRADTVRSRRLCRRYAELVQTDRLIKQAIQAKKARRLRSRRAEHPKKSFVNQPDCFQAALLFNQRL